MTAAALDAWRRDLGADQVLSDPATLDRYARSTVSQPVRALAVLRPSSSSEVIAAVKTAALHQIPLYPISRGRNWGYGDACPASQANVILDLGRMNRILEVDADLAYAVIEPGVTQGQLFNHLRDNRIPLWPDCTGAGPETSIVGNILDRGFGHTPYGNRAQAVCGMEVVLADGRVLRTGFGHYADARATSLYPYGVGPALDGLFTQSNMGIVTRLGLWLMPEPEAYEVFLCILDSDEDLGRFIEQLRTLRLEGTLRSVMHIGNDLRVLSGGMTFPRTMLREDESRLPPDLRATLRRQAGIGAWTAIGALYGSRDLVAAGRRRIKRVLAGRGRRMHFFNDRRLRLADLAARIAAPFGLFATQRRLLPAARSLYDMNRGKPSKRFLAGAYWRHRSGMPTDIEQVDPAADGCGLLWLSPVLPATAQAVKEFLGITEPIFAHHGFDFFVTFSSVTERALGAVMTVAYDQEDPAETKAALACYDACLAATMSAGFPSYRVGPHATAHLAKDSSGYWETVEILRQALDPADLIAPGRYDPFFGPSP